MTRDDLWVRLLLLGFEEHGRYDCLIYSSTHIEFSIFHSVLHPDDVNVRVRYRRDDDAHLYGLRDSPQAVFNYIKGELL